MEMSNSSLQQEVMMLRSEVQQLKSILIAHKDCPLIVHHTKGEEARGGREEEREREREKGREGEREK